MNLRNSKIRQLMIMALFLFPVSVWAAPSVTGITGTVSHGQKVTISGVTFGTHTNYSNNGTWKGNSFINRGFRDFEDKSLNSNQFYVDEASNWAIESSGGRTGSSYHAKKYYNTSRLGALCIDSLSQHTEWFASFWFKMPAGTSSGKPMRVWSGTSGNDVTLFAGGYDGDTNLRGTDGKDKTAWESGTQLQYGTWQRIDFYMRDVATNDRAVQTWINGAPAWSYVNVSGAWPPYYPYNDSGHTWDFGNLFDGPSGNYQFDDIYVSHTRARVEIANASTWSGSNHREIQIPNAWSASSITVTINQGAFSSGNTVYLYVVDANGNVNTNGYPITIGGGGTGSPPNAPQDLRTTTP